MIRPLSKIQYILILLFTGLAVLLLITSGYMLHWSMYSSMEKQLGQRLASVAAATGTMFSPEEVDFMRSSRGRTAGTYFKSRLTRLADAAGADRIFLFDTDLYSILDTDSTIQQDAPLFSLQFYESEIEKVFTGVSNHSILFTGESGTPHMTGFAPLVTDGSIAGGIGVEAGAGFLTDIHDVDRALILIGIIGILAAVFIGSITAAVFTRQIKKLAAISEHMSQGDYSRPLHIKSRNEIGTLADTMEIMRKNIIRREEELKAMVAGIAHEIRNPLGGIELYTGLLTKQVIDSKSKEYCGTISKELTHLRNIVTDFLQYARPGTPAPAACNIHDAVSETLDIIRPGLEQKKLSVETHVTGNSSILADSSHAHQILMNILVNAVEASPRGGVIKVDITDSHHAVSVTIADQGPGIDTNAQEHLFSPFFSTKETGTGLGLSIVKSLAEINNALIRFESDGTSGTKFEVLFMKPQGETHS